MNRTVRLAWVLGAALAIAGCKTGRARPVDIDGQTTTSTTTVKNNAVEASVPSPIEPWRAQPPTAGPQPELHLPVFQEAKLSNGLTLLVSEVDALPIISFALVSRGGSALEPPDKAGLVSLAFSLLDEGAGKLDALQFSDAIADLGASFASAASQDGGTLSISGLSRNSDAMLALMADVVLRPRLDPKDFERVKAQTLATLLRARSSPEGLAFEHVPAMIYGAKHAYGHPVTGTEETVSKLKLQEVKAMLSRLMVPGASALLVTGKITLAEAKTLAERHLGKWRGGAAPKVSPAAVEAKPREQLLLLHKPDSPQTMVVLGRPVFGRGGPDEAPLTLANQIFGGSFASRLNMNLRESKGYTYGAHSTVSLRRGVGALFAYAKVRADATAPSIKEFVSELEGMTKNPASADEIDRAKDGLVRSLPGEFERITAIATAASALFLYDLPLDYFAQYPGRIRAVDAAAITRAAQQYLSPEQMQILLVGDEALIAKELEALGLGKVVVRRP